MICIWLWSRYKELQLKLIMTFKPAVGIFIQTAYKTPHCAFAFPFPPWLQDCGYTWTPQQSAGLTANSALCHGVHWLSYLPIYYSWIATSLAWNLLSDFVRVTWDAWCCNCWAFTNGGSIANVFMVILTYQDTSRVSWLYFTGLR